MKFNFRNTAFLSLSLLTLSACESVQESAQAIKSGYNTLTETVTNQNGAFNFLNIGATEAKVLKPAEVDLGPVTSLAVTELKGNAGPKARSLVIERLNESGRFKLINRADLASALKELNFQNSGIVNTSTARSIGKMYGVDALIVGTLDTTYSVENGSSKSQDKDGRVVTTYSQKGTVTAEGSLGVIFLETGQFLAFKDIFAQKDDTNSSSSGSPTQVNQPELEKQALNAGVETFVQSISPHYQMVKINFASPESEDGKRAKDRAKRGNWPEAVSYFEKEAKDFPESDGSWYNLGLAYQYNRQFQKALKAYEKAYDLDSKKKYDEAIQNLAEVEREHERATMQLSTNAQP